MPNTQPHIAKWLRLTEAGSQRLSSCFPTDLKGARLHEHITKMDGAMVSKNTISRILKREQPVQFYSLANIFQIFGLKFKTRIFNPFPERNGAPLETTMFPRNSVNASPDVPKN